MSHHIGQFLGASEMRSPTLEKEELSSSCHCRKARQYEKELLKRAAELERQAELAAEELVRVTTENREELERIWAQQEIERMQLKDELETCDFLRAYLLRSNLEVMNGDPAEERAAGHQ
ncbi:hypothetical protein GCK32_018266 [Trichostrongylus colubriformis]|uniref:Uncharacterized protein n=1 Tax=Trichostrongylus colubriformis TaxID=6319 RepID=A0AAN8ETB5_TRICO